MLDIEEPSVLKEIQNEIHQDLADGLFESVSRKKRGKVSRDDLAVKYFEELDEQKQKAANDLLKGKGAWMPIDKTTLSSLIAEIREHAAAAPGGGPSKDRAIKVRKQVHLDPENLEFLRSVYEKHTTASNSIVSVFRMHAASLGLHISSNETSVVSDSKVLMRLITDDPVANLLTMIKKHAAAAPRGAKTHNGVTKSPTHVKFEPENIAFLHSINKKHTTALNSLVTVFRMQAIGLGLYISEADLEQLQKAESAPTNEPS